MVKFRYPLKASFNLHMQLKSKIFKILLVLTKLKILGKCIRHNAINVKLQRNVWSKQNVDGILEAQNTYDSRMFIF